MNEIIEKENIIYEIRGKQVILEKEILKTKIYRKDAIYE